MELGLQTRGQVFRDAEWFNHFRLRPGKAMEGILDFPDATPALFSNSSNVCACYLVRRTHGHDRRSYRLAYTSREARQ